MASRSKSESRKQQIVRTAFDQLVDRGFEGLRVRDVADAVGINQATLLYYFPDKETLITAVANDIIARFRAFNQEAAASASGDLYEQHLSVTRDLIIKHPALYVGIAEIAVRAIRSPQIAACIADADAQWTSFIGSLLSAKYPHAPARRISTAAAATISQIRGVSITAAGNGTLTSLLRRDGGFKQAKARIVAELDPMRLSETIRLLIDGPD